MIRKFLPLLLLAFFFSPLLVAPPNALGRPSGPQETGENAADEADSDASDNGEADSDNAPAEEDTPADQDEKKEEATPEADSEEDASGDETSEGEPQDAKDDKDPDEESDDEESEEEKSKEEKSKEEKSKEEKSKEEKSKEEKSKEEKSKEEKSKREREPESPRRLPRLGHADSPKLPGQPWRVHDPRRPRPPMVAPGDSPAAPPADALVLFDGSDLSEWCHYGSEPGELLEPQWKVEDGYFEVDARSGSLYTLDSFGSCQLHIEWASPENPRGHSQGRGNSGIKFMEKFEVQVLDSYDNRTYADGQAAALYGQYPPMVNVSRKPGEWQTYDIIFEAPRFRDEELVKPAHVTVFHNGVLVHHRRQLHGPTGGGSIQKYPSMAPAAPLMLQAHGNPVRYRNIWIRRLDL